MERKTSGKSIRPHTSQDVQKKNESCWEAADQTINYIETIKLTEIYKSKSQLVKQYRMETILVDNGVKDLLEISKQKCNRSIAI